MAILRDRDFSLEIQYRAFEGGWVEYAIWARWKDEPVINDSILKRWGTYWGNRPKGAFLAGEERECGILPLLRRLLETNEAGYWEPLEPDILLAVYPDDSFPFLPSRWQRVSDRPDLRTAFEEEKERRSRPRLPSDYIELMLYVDIYNFEGCDGYSGSGLGFRLSPTRAELTQFYVELRTEYVIFRDKWQIEEFNRRELGIESPSF